MLSHIISRGVGRRALASVSPLALAIGGLCLAQTPAAAGCLLSAPLFTWNSGSGNWSAAGNWAPTGGPPNSGTANACIVDGSSAVTVDGGFSVGSLQLASGNAVNIPSGSTLSVSGSQVINAGGLNIYGGSNGNGLVQIGSSAISNVTLTGGGTVTLGSSGGDSALIRAANNGNTLTNQDNTIQGGGSIGDVGALAFVNKATVNANLSGQALGINYGNGGVTNTRTLEATNGGTLFLYNGVTNTGGLILANGGAVALNGASITGGTLTSTNGGTINAANNTTLSNLTLSSGSTVNTNGGNVTYLNGAIVNKGTLSAGNGATTGTYQLGSDVTLSGGGKVTLAGYLRGFGTTLTNQDNTIQGSGSIGDVGALAFVNGPNGTLSSNVSGGTLSVGGAAGSFTNNGLVTVAKGSTLTVAADANGYVQQNNGSRSAVTRIDGVLNVSGKLQNLSGLLEGSGVINGNVTNAGVLHPGDSPGILTINGNLTNTSASHLAITLAGTAPGTGYSQLVVHGNVLFAGALDVSTSAFSIATGESFQIAQFNSGAGDFGAFDFNGGACTSGAGDTWSCANGVEFQEAFLGAMALNLDVIKGGSLPGAPSPVPGAGFAGLAALALAALYARTRHA
ncbi:MAG: hypothetical protein WAK01_02190 [Methylocystis sp.]